MGLFSLFAQDNFSLIAVILGMPLIGAFVNGIWGRRLGKEAVRLMALAAVGISFLAALYAFGALYHFASIQKNGEHFAHTKLSWLAWNWMHASALRGNAEHAEFISAPIDLKFSIDFRNIYASLLENWLDVPSKPILGRQFETAKLVKG